VGAVLSVQANDLGVDLADSLIPGICLALGSGAQFGP
jgi:hypothetical protein